MTAVITLGCLSVGMFLIGYNFLPSTARSLSADSTGAWVSPVDDLMKAVGPVASIVVEATDLSTDGSSTELARYPLMEFQYATSGGILKRIDYAVDKSRSPSRTYTYDNKGKLIQENYHNAVDGEIDIETTYLYDAQGRPFEAISHDTKPNSLLSKEIYVHDPKRNYVEVNEYWGQPLRAKVGYLKDALGKVVERQQLSTLVQGQASLGYAGKTNFTYNDKGDVVQELSYGVDGNLASRKTFTYEYDSYGNWIKRTSTTEQIDGTSIETINDILYRKITYYP